MVITHKWNKVKNFMKYLQFAPHICFLLIHLLWNAQIRAIRGDYPSLNRWTVTFLLFFIAYFGAIEVF